MENLAKNLYLTLISICSLRFSVFLGVGIPLDGRSKSVSLDVVRTDLHLDVNTKYFSQLDFLKCLGDINTKQGS